MESTVSQAGNTTKSPLILELPEMVPPDHGKKDLFDLFFFFFLRTKANWEHNHSPKKGRGRGGLRCHAAMPCHI